MHKYAARKQKGEDRVTIPGNPSTPAFYPLCLNLTGKCCVVVGGGEVARRKVEALLAAGGRVTVVSPDLVPSLRQLQEADKIHHLARAYREGDLAEAFVAIAATDDPRVNHAVAAEARRQRVLVNVVDDPGYCDFTLPSVLRRGDLLVAIFTGGRSPAFARHVREELEGFLTPDYVALLDLVAAVRSKLLARGLRVSGQAWRQALDGELKARVKEGDLYGARELLLARLTGSDF